jgi:CotS family spore coat protein
MEDRHEEVLKQYDLKVHNTYRTRGALLLDTNRGVKLYKKFESTRNRLEFENRIKIFLINKGYQNVDITLENKAGELITEDVMGGKHIVKNWFIGEECNLKDIEDVSKTSQNLGKLHNLLKQVPLIDETVCYDSHNLIKVFEKHNRELKRVRSYIREKKQKNEFEICILNSFNEFYEQAEGAISLLREINYTQMTESAKRQGSVFHGGYTYHNVLLNKESIATTNFEKSAVGIQILDLYYFLRKSMEKSDWKISSGKFIIDSYNQYSSINEEEKRLLYILILYPEKYWKIVNFYMNGKKSWISNRNILKLSNVLQQNRQKTLFCERLLDFHLN